MSNILLFTHKNAPVIVTVTKVKKDCATVRMPIYKVIGGKRYRDVFNEYNYIPVPVGCYIVTDEDGNEIAISAEALPVFYKPLGSIKMGENGRYQYFSNLE